VHRRKIKLNEVVIDDFCVQLLVLKYIQNKDVFMRYHKAHLTRRLILDTSADSDKEESMVEWCVQILG
jgi:hypothetical protein